MSSSPQGRNKAIALEAFETLFNKRDYAAAERFWSPNYIQQSAHIAPGREGLFTLVRSAPEGRPAAWIAADIIRSIGTFCRTRRPRPNP
jgi:predicted SnoaL-like aldol condensation-catalyzing enzyme